MKTLVYISLVLVFCFANNVLAGIFYWDKTFGGTSWDHGYSLQQTSDGGYIIAGYTWSYGNGYSDVWLIKTDVSGNKQWDKTFGGGGREYGYSVAQCSDDGYIITGRFGYNYPELYLIRTNAAGNEQWYKTFGDYDTIGYSVAVCNDGGYIITGEKDSWWNYFNIYLLKTNSLGQMQWDESFGGTGPDQGCSVAVCNDGGYIITGYTGSYGSGLYDVWLIKVDSLGDKLWDKTFGGSADDQGRSVAVCSDGGYIITGYTSSYGSGQADVWLIKTDASGNMQWDKTFGGTNDDFGYSVQQTSDSGYVITGYTESYGAGDADLWLIKTGHFGGKQWDKTFGGVSDDRGYSVQQTSNSGYIVTGYTSSYGAGATDVWLIYYKPEYEASISDLNLLLAFLIILSLSSLLFLKRKRA